MIGRCLKVGLAVGILALVAKKLFFYALVVFFVIVGPNFHF